MMKTCVPSYQLPGTWLFNVEKLAGLPWIGGIELLFFSFDSEAREIFAREAEAIQCRADRFSFSLHLPDPLMPDDEALIELTEPFVELFVFHPCGPNVADRGASSGDGGAEGAGAWAAMIEGFRARHGREKFAMEYTGAQRFAESLRLLPDIALCADTGCLLREGLDPAHWISARADRVREIHLHAARNGKDHLPLSGGEPWLCELAPFLCRSDWRVNFETFSLENTQASYEAFKRTVE